MTSTMKTESITEKTVLTVLAIPEIKKDLVDFRDKQEEYDDRGSEEFEHLKNSIKEFGVITPLHVAETKEGYELVDGRRRLLAAKQLGLKQVPVLLIQDSVNKERLAAITLIQNIHRKDLNDAEKARGIAKLFEMNGYTDTQSKHYIKAIHDQRPMRDEKFRKIYESIGWSPMYVFKLLQIVYDLDSDILDYAEKKGLHLEKKVLLTHTGLRGHEPMQKRLVTDIADRPIKEAREIAHQMVDDLKKGVITKTDGGSYVGGWREPEDKERPEIVKHPFQFFTQSNVQATELLRSLTGHTLTRGEVVYEKKHLEYPKTKQHIKDMVAAMGEQQANFFSNKLVILDEVLRAVVKEIDERYPQ